MLIMGQQFIGKPVLSLRTGDSVGIVESAIINPHNLRIEGWRVSDRYSRQLKILLPQDVRDILEQGFVVDDHEALSDPAELVRLKPILDIGFELLSKLVITESKKRLGKVNDFAFDKDGFFVQKLYVSQSVVKNFSGGGAIVDRDQIVDINNKRITVSDASLPGKVSTAVAAA